MIHICFSVHDEAGYLSKFTGTAMLSIFENISKPSTSVTVHILHDNTLTNDNRNKFSYLAGHYGQRVKFYNVEELFADKIAKWNALFNEDEKTRFSQTMFYKLLVPQVLSLDIEKAIYLEPNIIVNLDISELWRIDLEDKMLAAVPILSINTAIQIKDKVVTDGFVKQEDYFNSGILLMNLKLLRGEEEKITEGLTFAHEHKYFTLLDQTILNYCFSLQTVKLSSQFNQFVMWARHNQESLANKIYYYTTYSLQLNMNDPFNRLWIDSFAKTPWFNAETLARLYDGFRQVHNKLKKSLANLSVVLNGKSRAFCAMSGYVKELKRVFNMRDDEELILLENRASLNKLIDAMKQSQGKKVFFIVAQNFPFNLLMQSGFAHGKDFINGLEFFSEEQGISMNSYPFIYAM